LSVLADPDAEMIDSIRAGLAAARDHGEPDNVLLQLADHPEVCRDTLHGMLAASSQYYGRAIIPTYRDQGGHPILIPRDLVMLVLRLQMPGGLRAIWHEHPEWCCRLPVDDPRVVRDVDCPNDLPPRVAKRGNGGRSAGFSCPGAIMGRE
jgi:molybdenum cofactor cytidylyltransferase